VAVGYSNYKAVPIAGSWKRGGYIADYIIGYIAG
jgi:hypothetical protein